MFGVVEVTATSAREEADDVPSTPAAALGELDYNVVQFNALRDFRADGLPAAVGLCATRCHRTAAPAPQKGPGLGRGTLVTSVPFALGPITRPGATAVLPPQSSRREGV